MGTGWKTQACIRSTSSPRPRLQASAVLSSNISSYFSTANNIFCTSRGFMLRPPITKPTHKRQLHPNLLSTVSRSLLSSCLDASDFSWHTIALRLAQHGFCWHC